MSILQESQVLEGHDDRVWHVAFSLDGASIATCGGDKSIRIWSKSLETNREGQWVCGATLEEAQAR
jgi:WD40 repeat protein